MASRMDLAEMLKALKDHAAGLGRLPERSEAALCRAQKALFLSKEEIQNMEEYPSPFADTIEGCTKALELIPTCKRTLIVRAEAHENLQHFEEAIADMKEIAELEPTHDQAVEKMRHLEHLAAEGQMLLRSERLMAERRAMTKEEFIEMMRKAKNSLMEHFKSHPIKAVRDPITGSVISSMLP